MCMGLPSLITSDQDKEFNNIPGQDKKLDHKWLGPYKIEKTLPGGIYVLSLLNDPSKIKSVSGAHIKVYTKPTSVQVNTVNNRKKKVDLNICLNQDLYLNFTKVFILNINSLIILIALNCLM